MGEIDWSQPEALEQGKALVQEFYQCKCKFRRKEIQRELREWTTSANYSELMNYSNECARLKQW